MPCPVCHNQVPLGSAFCSQCGAPMPTAAAPGPGFTETYAPPPPPGYTPPQAIGASGLSNDAVAAISYITFIPATIFLVLDPYKRVPYIRFHAWQSIGFSVIAFLLHIILTVIQISLHFIPGTFIVFSLIHTLISLALFLVWLFLILKASRGEWFKLPVAGDFALKQSQV